MILCTVKRLKIHYKASRALTTFINKNPKVQLAPPELLNQVVNHFNAPIRYAIAYGSGVYQQGEPKKDDPGKQIDFVFGVTHPQHWHSLNLKQNPSHYSFLGSFGAPLVSHVQSSFGAKVYYNPFVTINVDSFGPVSVKYGVVSIDDLCDDLENWTYLYLAGRMQKPCYVIRDAPRVHLSNQANVGNALNAALLMLPETFTEEELFKHICSHSYTGDFRFMVRGEDPHKVDSLVNTQIRLFRRMYYPHIKASPNVSYTGANMLQQNMEFTARKALFVKLPLGFREMVRSNHAWYLSRINKATESKYSGSQLTPLTETDDEEIALLDLELARETSLMESLLSSPELPEYLNSALINTVRLPSLTQAIKGVFTSGLTKTSKYAYLKLKKSLLKF